MPTEIIAHRGASREAPENTLASIHLGWEQGADAVEIDVHQSRDGHMMVIHDATTRKTARLNRRVGIQTLAELKALDAGRWKNRRWSGEQIPTLAEAFATVPAGKRMFVEIKCSVDCLPQFVSTVRDSLLRPQQVVPIGFHLTTMRLIKWALPECEVCWVVAFRRSIRGWNPRVESIIAKAKEAGLDGIDVGARGPVNDAFTRKVHEAGLKLYIWTVDSPAKAYRLIAAGVDGITTNRPGWLRGQL